MADLDFIFRNAEQLQYLGEGKWQIKCPVAGCEKHTLQIEQTNYQIDRSRIESGLQGQILRDHECSLAQIIESLGIEPHEVFLVGSEYSRKSDDPKSLFNHKESIEFLAEEAKALASIIDKSALKDPSTKEAQRFRYLLHGVQWYLSGQYKWPVYDPFGIYADMELAMILREEYEQTN